MDFIVWFSAAIVAGAVLGSVATWWWTRGRGGGETIGQLKRENEQFREEVAEHFVETARLINRMTDSYKDVFDHLSRGADSLVDEQRLSEKMPRVSAEEVRLRHLGAPDAARASGARSGSPKREASPGDSADAGASGSGGATDSKTTAASSHSAVVSEKPDADEDDDREVAGAETAASGPADAEGGEPGPASGKTESDPADSRPTAKSAPDDPLKRGSSKSGAGSASNEGRKAASGEAN